MSISREIQLRLKSGNSVPVSSCRITKEEFMALCREVREDALRGPSMPVVVDKKSEAYAAGYRAGVEWAAAQIPMQEATP